MKKRNKRISLLVSLMMTCSSTAFADIPDFTAVIGENAYGLDYIAQEKNQKEIRDAIVSGKDIFIKTPNGWYDITETVLSKDIIPSVTYKDGKGTIRDYKEKDGEELLLDVQSIGFVSLNQVKLKFNKSVDKETAKVRENYFINNMPLSSEDKIEFKDDETVIITLHNAVKDQEEVEIKLSQNLEDSNKKKIEKQVISNQLILAEDNKEYKFDELNCDVSLLGENQKISSESISGNLILSGKNLEVKDCEVKNKIIVDTQENSKVKLCNIKTESIDVKACESITLNKVKGNKLELNNTGVTKIETDRNTKIQETKVSGSTVLKANSDSFGNITIASNEKIDVELDGNFKNTINVEGNAAIKSTKKVAVDIKGYNSEVELSGSFEKVSSDYKSDIKLNDAEVDEVVLNDSDINLEVDEESAIEAVITNGNDLNVDGGTENKNIGQVVDKEENKKNNNNKGNNNNNNNNNKGNNNNNNGNNNSGNDAGKDKEDEQKTSYVNVKTVKATRVDQITIELDKEIDDWETDKTAFQLKINNEPVEIRYIDVDGKSIEINLNSYEVIGDKLQFNYKMKQGDKVSLKYIATGNNDVECDGNKLENFTSNIEVEGEFKDLSDFNMRCTNGKEEVEVILDKENKTITFLSDMDLRDLIVSGYEFDMGESNAGMYVSLNENSDGPYYECFFFVIGADGSYEVYTSQLNSYRYLSIEEIKDVTLKEGEIKTIEVTTNVQSELSATSDNEEVVQANINGNQLELTALKEGTSNITVKAKADNYEDVQVTFKVTVEKNVISVQQIKLDKQEVKLNIGDTTELKAEVLPRDTTNKNITWESEDESVATVKNGVITAVSEGVTFIKVITEDGNKEARCKVTVEKAVKIISAEAMTLDYIEIELDSEIDNEPWFKNEVFTVNINGKDIKEVDAHTFDKKIIINLSEAFECNGKEVILKDYIKPDDKVTVTYKPTEKMHIICEGKKLEEFTQNIDVPNHFDGIDTLKVEHSNEYVTVDNNNKTITIDGRMKAEELHGGLFTGTTWVKMFANYSFEDYLHTGDYVGFVANDGTYVVYDITVNDDITIEAIEDVTLDEDQTTTIDLNTNVQCDLSATSDNEEIVQATIKGNQLEVKGLKEGTANITVRGTNDRYNDGSVTFKVTVEKPVKIISAVAQTFEDIKIQLDRNTDNEDVVVSDLLTVTINGKEIEKLSAITFDEKIFIHLNEGSDREGKEVTLKDYIKPGDKVTVTYNPTEEKYIICEGKKLQEFTQTIEVPEHFDTIDDLIVEHSNDRVTVDNNSRTINVNGKMNV